jgi:outer membrane protein insertion porin family
VRTQNFLGRGETVGVSFQSGRYADQFDVSYFVPWFLDRPQSIGVQVFSTDLDYSQLSGQDARQKSEGVVVSYGRSVGLFSNFSISLTRSDLDQRSRFLTVDGQSIVQQFQYANTSIRPSWVYESRDNRFEPTIGSRITTSVEYAGGFLGGDNYFVRPEAGASWFHPVTRAPFATVVALNAEAGYVSPFEGRDLNRFERYFLGGETSIRGFKYRTLWVRCEGGEPYPGRPAEPCHPDETMIESELAPIPLGGDKYVQLNLEYHFLLGGPFRLLAFVDGANVFGDDQSMDFGRLRWTAGAEVRIFVPMFGAPLRFIYSSNLDPLPDDQFESFQFSIGATF